MPTKDAKKQSATTPHSIKETLTSISIAFAMAFMFRGFVIEGFVIPTGSMAPTLLGKHMQFDGPESGSQWDVGPWYYTSTSAGSMPLSTQGIEGSVIEVNDPMTGNRLSQTGVPLRSGDRIFISKYVEPFYRPDRWDVVVFKNPESPRENFIKRLIGMPNEQLALVDGDVFVRPIMAEKGQVASDGVEAWAEEGWTVARKPERIQRAVWQTVFDSTFTPIEPTVPFRPPWRAGTSGWTGLRDARAYTYEGTDRTSLEWVAERTPIDDYNAYNQVLAGGQPFDRNFDPRQNAAIFPVADIAASFRVEPANEVFSVSGILSARGRVFEASIISSEDRSRVTIRHRADGPAAPVVLGDDAWTVLHEVDVPGAILPANRVSTLEVWHADQAISVYVDGELIAGGNEDGAYTLTPAQRIEWATGKSLTDVLATEGAPTGGPLSDASLYRKPTFRWEFASSPFELHAVKLKRDLHYQASPRTPTRGALPDMMPVMDADQYFFCGDNSPRSKDSRLWAERDLSPWIRASIDPSVGTIHRDLIIGKAFIVYFPSLHKAGRLPIPNVGDVRWIW